MNLSHKAGFRIDAVLSAATGRWRTVNVDIIFRIAMAIFKEKSPFSVTISTGEIRSVANALSACRTLVDSAS